MKVALALEGLNMALIGIGNNLFFLKIFLKIDSENMLHINFMILYYENNVARHSATLHRLFDILK